MLRRLIILVAGFLAVLWCVQWGWVRWKLADWDARVAVLVADGFLPAVNAESAAWTEAELERFRDWILFERTIGAAVRVSGVVTNDALPLTPAMARSLRIEKASLQAELAGLDALLAEEQGKPLRDSFGGAAASAVGPRSFLSVVGCAFYLGERALRGPEGAGGVNPRAFALLFDYVGALREGSTALTIFRWRLERYALRCLRGALQDPDVDAAALASALDQRLARMASESRYRAALRCHFAMHLDDLHRPHMSAGWAIFERGAALDQHEWLLTGFEALVRHVPHPGESPRNSEGVLEFPGRALSGVPGVPRAGRRRAYARNGLTAIEREFQSLRRAHQLARVALALTAYRQAEGHWPAELTALDPPAAPDPATGEPFVYGSTRNKIWLEACDLSHLGPAFASAPVDDLLRWTSAR